MILTTHVSLPNWPPCLLSGSRAKGTFCSLQPFTTLLRMLHNTKQGTFLEILNSSSCTNTLLIIDTEKVWDFSHQGVFDQFQDSEIRLSISAIYGPKYCTIFAICKSRNKAEPFLQFLDTETLTFRNFCFQG